MGGVYSAISRFMGITLPFTLSHAAAALPFYRYRRYLPFDALVIGCFVPDVPRVTSIGDGILSHQWTGLFTYCLPVGLLIYVIWLFFLRKAFFVLLPTPFDRISLHYHKTMRVSMASMVWTILALMLGAISHILWDAVTHINGFISINVSILQAQLSFGPQSHMTVFRFLQYLSTVLGLLAVLGFMSYRYHRFMIKHQSKTEIMPSEGLTSGHKRIVFLLIIFLVTGLAIYAMLNEQGLISSDIYMFFAEILVAVLQGLLIGLFGFALIYHLMCLKRSIDAIRDE